MDGRRRRTVEKMLVAKRPKERLAAAVTLAPLGKADLALPVIEAALQSNPEYLEIARDVLPWLAWERRIATFSAFEMLAKNEDASLELISSHEQSTPTAGWPSCFGNYWPWK